MSRRPINEEDRATSTPEERGDDRNNPVELVSLSGIGMTSEGDMIKRDFFAFMKGHITPENDRVLKREDAVKLQKRMIALATGTSAGVPLLCAAGKCPIKEICPFMSGEIDGGPPVGYQCPIEGELVRFKKKQFIEEYGINLNSPTEMSLLDELVRIEIYENRIAIQLSQANDAGLVTEEVMAHDREGEEVRSRQATPLLDVQERLWNRKSKVIQHMVGDRREQYKKDAALKQQSGGSAVENWTDLAKQMDEAIQQANSIKKKGEELAAKEARNVTPSDDGNA